MVKVLVIGGSHAGVAAVRSIKDQVPSAEIIWVSKDSIFFYNIAVPRLLVEPEHHEKLTFDLQEYSQKWGVKFVKETVAKIDFSAKKVDLSSGEQIAYDNVVLATGTATFSDALKLNASYQATRNAIDQLTADIKSAENIVVVGAGPTGVEICGEIKYRYPRKTVTLYTGAAMPLPLLANEKLSTRTEQKLRKLGVEVVNGVKLRRAEKAADGKWKLDFNDGSSVTTDVYVPSYGIKPSADYVDSRFLDDRGYVRTDEYLRVLGTEHAYALGDIVAGSKKSFVDLVYYQLATFKATLKHDLRNQGSLKKWAPSPRTTILVPIGPKDGVGALFDMSAPSFVIKHLKSKHFYIPEAGDAFK